ncbi:MAG: hypothetical protein AB1551_05190 [Actinomycetota bacterium]
MAGLIGLVLAGDVSPPGPGRLSDDLRIPDRKRKGATPAWLILHRTTGWPGSWQVDLRLSFSARWRGPGAAAAGVAWVGPGGLMWSPTPSWRELGARAFELRFDLIDRIEVTPLTARSGGLVVHLGDGVQVWLWLRKGDPVGLVNELRARSQA